MNILNPKIVLFFLAAFGVIASPHTPGEILAVYIAMIYVTTFVWFLIVAVCFSLPKVHRILARFHHWFERIMGGFLIVLGIKLVLMSLT